MKNNKIVIINKVLIVICLLFCTCFLSDRDEINVWDTLHKMEQQSDYQGIIIRCTKELLFRGNGVLFTRSYLMKRAKAYEEIGNFEEAITDYTEAMRIDPKNDDYYSCRASVYSKLGKFDNALADLQKAIEIAPIKGLYAYYQRGDIYYELGRFEEALADYNEAIKGNDVYGFSSFTLEEIKNKIAKIEEIRVKKERESKLEEQLTNQSSLIAETRKNRFLEGKFFTWGGGSLGVVSLLSRYFSKNPKVRKVFGFAGLVSLATLVTGYFLQKRDKEKSIKNESEIIL